MNDRQGASPQEMGRVLLIYSFSLNSDDEIRRNKINMQRNKEGREWGVKDPARATGTTLYKYKLLTAMHAPPTRGPWGG